ncbi:MAG: ABC transporter permease [Caldilineaceae bacterium]|nr:ABC transporter permease [Caldilineaceae bacterium]
MGPEEHRSLWEDALRRLRSNPGAMLGLALLVIIITLTLLAPWITRYDPIEIVSSERLQPPGPRYWLGTDAFGRDMLTRILYGGRISLSVGIISVTIAALLGVTSGMLAGYFGGWTDTLIMRLVDLTLAFPGILLALFIIAVLGPSLYNAMIAVGIAASPTYARVTRGMVLQIKATTYVEAAVATGAPPQRILLRHILPNILGAIIVIATLGVASAIIAGAALSFLGLGAKPPTPEWGLILSEGRSYLRHAPWITTFPGLAIMLAVLSINLLGDGLRDALEPRSQR